MSAFVLQLHRMVVLAVLSVALVGTGFAHRAPVADEQTVAAILLSGATAADICGTLGESGRHVDPLCQACQITGGTDLPPLAPVVRPLGLTLLADVSAPRESRRVERVLDLSRTPQGPPLV
ncbi:MAG: hypothetical protein V4720_00665 [Pseudomonadota bacterium]